MEENSLPLREGLIVEVNRQCNIKCNFCPVPIKRERIERSIEEIERILRDPLLEKIVRKENGKFLHLSISGGEPFLHSRINDIIKLFSELAKEVLVVSNMTEVKDSHLLTISSLENVYLQISFVADNRELYREITKADLFEEFLRNVKKAVDIIGGKRLHANIVAGKLNQNRVIEIIDKAHSLGIENIRVHPLVATNKFMTSLLPENYPEFAYSLIEKVNNKYKGLPFDFKVVIPKTYDNSPYWYLSMDSNLYISLFHSYLKLPSS